MPRTASTATDGNCLADADGDGVCDGDEVPGCTDDMACNYDMAATDDDGSCTYAEDGLDCDGNCLADADGDGICDDDEVPGCTDGMACNYDMAATDDDGSCTYAEDGLDCDGNCLADADGDGVCDGDEVPGCTDETANNYDPAATDDDGSCDYACGPEWGEPTTYPSVATVLALITVDGENADMEDAVAAYVGDELRGTGDIIDFDGATYVNMTVYLAGGEEMVDFLFFNQDECTTCTMDAGLTAMSFGEYGSFDDPLMFDANCSATTLEVSAMEGWNYVSTNVMPENYAISSLFEDALGGDLLKVLGDDDFALGGSYTPGIPSVFNSLQTHSDAAGYVIKLSADGLWASSVSRSMPLPPRSTSTKVGTSSATSRRWPCPSKTPSPPSTAWWERSSTARTAPSGTRPTRMNSTACSTWSPAVPTGSGCLNRPPSPTLRPPLRTARVWPSPDSGLTMLHSR